MNQTRIIYLSVCVIRTLFYIRALSFKFPFVHLSISPLFPIRHHYISSTCVLLCCAAAKRRNTLPFFCLSLQIFGWVQPEFSVFRNEKCQRLTCDLEIRSHKAKETKSGEIFHNVLNVVKICLTEDAKKLLIKGGGATFLYVSFIVNFELLLLLLYLPPNFFAPLAHESALHRSQQHLIISPYVPSLTKKTTGKKVMLKLDPRSRLLYKA